MQSMYFSKGADCADKREGLCEEGSPRAMQCTVCIQPAEGG